MKDKKWFGIRIVCIVLVFCFLSLTLASCATATNQKNELLKNNKSLEYITEDYNVQIVSEENTTSCISNSGDYEITITNDSGEIFYKDRGGTYPLVISDVNQDGLMQWSVQKDGEILEGELNTSEAPSPQFAVAIAGTTYAISAALYYMLKVALVVTIAGATCYVAEVVGTKLKNNSKTSNYFPAYSAFGNVYVATGIGISQGTAVARLKNGQHVWAKNEQYAYKACVMASPIGAAEWGWHGNRKTSSGYYQHYHAVKYYKSNGQYQHTGAHCWYM